MRAYFNKLMMYHEIHKLKRDGFSDSRISRELVMSRHTVSRYLSMSEEEYNLFLDKQSNRKKQLYPFEDFVKSKLEKYPDTSAAQMHDWLKEHYSSFPNVSPKTAYNFVMWVRQKYGIPKTTVGREYFIVEETDYGKQAQVDFGEYNMRDTHGKRMKVYFFSMALSRSRYKYVLFSQYPFTSASAVRAHERAFEYFGGIPSEIVYDQDKVFLTDENKGDLILTEKFKSYTQQRPFKLYFCRKADPESKGKIENVVKYIKQNFLYNRTFLDIETLNDEVLGWMGRTANALPHNRTKKEPHSEWIIEQPFLIPYTPFSIIPDPEMYTVRKDNTISWKSNLYTLPIGSYKGQGTQVMVKDEQGYLIMADRQGNEICRHKICTEKGQIISNTDHKREKSEGVDELIKQVAQGFDDAEKAEKYLLNIRQGKSRYIRDQLMTIKSIIEQTDKNVVSKALDFCSENKVFSATDFKSVAAKYARDEPGKDLSGIPEKYKEIKTINRQGNSAIQKPAISSIIDYESIMKNKN
jgi:transposase